MPDTPRTVQRTYLTLTLFTTLSASFIWGINTLFLLDAGLSNLEAFAANAFFTAGMVAFDVSGGLDHPVQLGHIPTTYSHTSVAATAGGRPVVLHGDEGFTGSDGGAFLRILDGDRSSPTYFTELARYQSRREVGIHNFQLVGNRLYIAYYQDGVRVIDLADPAHPVEVAHYNTWDPLTAPGGAFEGALTVQVVGDLIFVSDDLRGLLILRDPALAP